MGIFSDIYNTVAKFFRPQEETEGEASKSVATNRLKLVLMQDRTNLTPRILEQMRSELIDLLSRYVELDKELLELNFEQEGDQVALMLSIPVIRAKDEEEIEAALKAKKETEEQDEEDTEDESDEIEESEIVDEAEENSDEDNNDDEISDETEEIQDNEEDIIENNEKSKNVSTPKEMSSESSETVEEDIKTEEVTSEN